MHAGGIVEDFRDSIDALGRLREEFVLGVGSASDTRFVGTSGLC
jgi:hypothetical protein